MPNEMAAQRFGELVFVDWRPVAHGLLGMPRQQCRNDSGAGQDYVRRRRLAYVGGDLLRAPDQDFARHETWTSQV